LASAWVPHKGSKQTILLKDSKLNLPLNGSNIVSVHYPVNTSIQLRAVLQALRRSRSLSQEDVGRLLGVNQKRVARIENAPGVTGFDQIARLVTALGARLVIETPDTEQSTTAEKAKKGRGRKAKTQGNW
jgi:HTH-type transcriptional regulator/antitoxin HipB